MPGLTFKLTGFDFSELKKYAQDVQEGIKDDCTATSFDIEADAKNLAPVDLGNLRANISAGASDNGINVVSRAEYSAYVEFGTGTMVDVNSFTSQGSLEEFYTSLENMQEYALQFKGAGIRKVNLPARPFFFPSVQKGWDGLLSRIKATLQGK